MSITPDDAFDTVCDTLETLVAVADDHGGFVPAMLDRDALSMPEEPPPAIPGQRESDRAPGGCNLLDDIPVLETLEAVAARGHPEFADAADRYLRRFVEGPARTPTGLFPWGDHAYWDLEREVVGDAYVHSGAHEERRPVHDQRRVAPPWFWRRLHEHDSDTVQDFADGLGFHWLDRPNRFNRHAWIERREPGEWGPAERSCDFPRHAGTFVLDWAAAYELDPREGTREQIRDMADYWWSGGSGPRTVPYESEGHSDPSPEQTLSLGICLLEAAETLAGTDEDLADELRRRGRAYVEGFAESAPRGAPVWWSGYPNSVRAGIGVVSLAAYRHTGHERLLARAKAIGDDYRRIPMPDHVAVPAADPGLALALLADLNDETGDERWREAGLSLATDVVDRYFDGALPRAATGVDRYESALGTGQVIRGMARLAETCRSDDPVLGPGVTLLPAGYRRTETHPF